jgi:hypothetical protein
MAYARGVIFLSAVVLVSTACGEKERAPLLVAHPAGENSVGEGGAAGSSGSIGSMPPPGGVPPGTGRHMYAVGAPNGTGEKSPLCQVPGGKQVGEVDPSGDIFVGPHDGHIYYIEDGDVVRMNGEKIIDVESVVTAFTIDRGGNFYYLAAGGSDLKKLNGDVVVDAFPRRPTAGSGTILSWGGGQQIDVFRTQTGNVIQTYDAPGIGLVRVNGAEKAYWAVQFIRDAYGSIVRADRYVVDEDAGERDFSSAFIPWALDEEGSYVAVVLNEEDAPSIVTLDVENERTEDAWPRTSPCTRLTQLVTAP